MRITKDTFVESLKGAVPRFVIDPEWAKDNLGYLIIDDLARYVCQEADFVRYINDADGYPDQVEASLVFVEKCLEDGDPYVRGLVHECLESLLSCDRISEIRTRFGSLVCGLWEEFFEDMYQKNLETRQQ